MADDKRNESMPILPTDGELLMRFRLHADQQAFAELMRKHAPMVMAVCRKVLVSQADAEDVFQATFLTLVQRAHTVRQKNSLASWLHQIAYRLSLNYAKQKKRRREEMLSGEESILNDELDAISERSLHSALHEELAQLPETYRAPLVLCYLEERSRSEAADELECTEASIKARLARGKRLLRKRLMHRGLTLSAVMTAVVACLKPTGAVAAGWVPLLENTTFCCATLARTGTTTGLDAHVISIVNQGIRTMVLTSTTKISLALAASLIIIVAGISSTIKADAGERAEEGVVIVNLDSNSATGEHPEAVQMTVTIAPNAGEEPIAEEPLNADKVPSDEMSLEEQTQAIIAILQEGTSTIDDLELIIKILLKRIEELERERGLVEPLPSELPPYDAPVPEPMPPMLELPTMAPTQPNPTGPSTTPPYDAPRPTEPQGL